MSQQNHPSVKATRRNIRLLTKGDKTQRVSGQRHTNTIRGQNNGITLPVLNRSRK